MSVNNCQLTLPNNTDERRPQEHRGGSLTPRLFGIHLSSLITENIHKNIKYYELFHPNSFMTQFDYALESYTTSKRRIVVTLKNVEVSGLFRSITVESALTK
jgi:hypothetical protein